MPPDQMVACQLSVDPSGTHLLRDGQPLFLLADTLWAAFSRMTEHEWLDALRLRRRQGFNAINISILPIAHDRTLSGEALAPFRVHDGGSWDLDEPDRAYFRRAGQMVQVAAAHDLSVVLVALWCNYVPNTWGSAKTPELAMDEQQTARYLDLVLDTFAALRPIFCVSGDDSLDDPVALTRYRTALHQLKTGAPGCLTTLHSNPSAELPQEWADDPALDLYAYQAGHDVGWEERSITMPARYAGIEPRKPVFSMEPCYEGHGFGAGRERHDARNVRRASWSGLLAGAGGGLGYAAHGAWSWHRAGEDFNGEHFSGVPLPASRAMELPGAWDVGLLRRLVETYGLYDLRPRPDLVLDNASSALLSTTPDGRCAVAFLPEAFRLRLDLDLAGWTVEVWDLARGRRDHVDHAVVGGRTIFAQPDVIEDLLYVMWS